MKAGRAQAAMMAHSGPNGCPTRGMGPMGASVGCARAASGTDGKPQPEGALCTSALTQMLWIGMASPGRVGLC